MIQLPLAPERGARLLIQAVLRVQGEAAGHEFHGNQWFSGVPVYHGTSSELLASIKEKGLVPQGAKGADTWAVMKGMKPFDQIDVSRGFTQALVNDRKASVFITDQKRTAAIYARYAAEVNGGKPVILAVDLPNEVIPKPDPTKFDEWKIKPDEASGTEMGSYRFRGPIKPEWIKGRFEITPDGFVKQKLVALATFTPGTTRVYVVIIVKNDDLRIAEFDVQTFQIAKDLTRDEAVTAARRLHPRDFRGVTYDTKTGIFKVMGEAEGHDFHGNQWTDQVGATFDAGMPHDPTDDIAIHGTDPQDVEAAHENLSRIPPQILEEADLNTVHVFNDPADLSEKIDNYLMKHYGFDADGQARTLVDTEKGEFFALSDPQHFYEQLSHAYTDRIESDDWRRVTIGEDPVKTFEAAFAGLIMSHQGQEILSMSNPLTAILERKPIMNVLKKWGWA